MLKQQMPQKQSQLFQKQVHQDHLLNWLHWKSQLTKKQWTVRKNIQALKKYRNLLIVSAFKFLQVKHVYIEIITSKLNTDTMKQSHEYLLAYGVHSSTATRQR